MSDKEKEKQEKKVEEPKPEEKEKGKGEFRHRVRVLRIVIDGNLDVPRALVKIKGIGYQTSTAVITELNIDKKTKLGSLSDKEIERIENTIKELHNHIPGWMNNRQREPYSGKDIHIVGPDLELATREDINLQKKLKSYRGVRHSFGLPVRGQRTRTSFRTGATIGVSRKKVQQSAKSKKKDGGKK